MSSASILPSVKPTTLVLAASLVANLAVVGVYFSSRSTNAVSAPASSATAAAKSTAGRAANADALRAALDSGDAAALEAAGLSADTARELVLGRSLARIAEKMRAAQAAASGDGKWWRSRSGSNPAAREQMMLVRRELSDALIAAFGDDFMTGGGVSQLSFLSPQKRDALRKITQDYDEMMAKYGAQDGVQLASDREKLKLLKAERERDFAALLSPDELLEYQMRTSGTGMTLRSRLGEAIASEEDFKRLFILQKAFDEKYSMEGFNGRITPEVMRQRSEASQQLQADMRAALGDDAYKALQRASDNDVRTLDSLITRLSLPADTTDKVLAARDSYSAESKRIMADAATPFPQRREQIQALAARAKTELASTLGTEAADAYAQRSQWVNMLQGGMGFSTNPNDAPAGAMSFGGGFGSGVVAVTPAGVGNVRQAVSFSSSTSGPSPSAGGGPMIISTGDGPGPGQNMHQAITIIQTDTGRAPGSATSTTTAPAAVPATPLPAATPPRP